MKNKILFYIVSIIILLIIFPLLKPWYIFSLDQVLNPNWWVPIIGSNIFLVWIFSQIFNFLNIPIWILEKIIIILTFVIPAFWGYLLSKKTKNIYAILFTILFLIFNPFLYDRFLDWQINIYLSYSLYPLFLYFLKNTLENHHSKKYILLWLFSLILCLISIHNIIFLLFIFVIFSIFYIKKTWVKNISKILISVLIFNLLWILPFLFLKTEKFELAKQIDNFWNNHQQAFKTVSWDANIYFNVLSMHWYWGENQKRFTTVAEINTKWKNLFILIFFIVLLWIYSRIKEKKFNNFEKSLLILALVSYILALWISENNIFSFINKFLYDYLPFYKWFREPQKWVIFIVIFYAYFGWFWIKFLSEKIKKINIEKFIKIFILSILAVMPIFYNSDFFWSFWWQISIKQYPKQWKEIKNIIFEENNIFEKECKYLEEKKSTSCYNTLSLPWHSYMWFNFTKKRTGWWIVRYFWDNILISDNLEYSWIYTQSTRIESKIIEKYIWPKWVFKNIDNIKKEDLNTFILDLKNLEIKNIILLKEVDFVLYKDFLNLLEEKKYIDIKKENDMIILYKIY